MIMDGLMATIRRVMDAFANARDYEENLARIKDYATSGIPATERQEASDIP